MVMLPVYVLLWHFCEDFYIQITDGWNVNPSRNLESKLFHQWTFPLVSKRKCSMCTGCVQNILLGVWFYSKAQSCQPIQI